MLGAFGQNTYTTTKKFSHFPFIIFVFSLIFSKKNKNISFSPLCFVYSGGSSLFGHPTALAALFVHRFRHPLPDYAHHQRIPLFGHDLLLFQDRSHREGAQHHRGVWPLSLLARIAVRITVKLKESKESKTFFFFFRWRGDVRWLGHLEASTNETKD